jgi:hypothetical protein
VRPSPLVERHSSHLAGRAEMPDFTLVLAAQRGFS